MNKEKYINNIPQELKECKQWLWFKIYHNEDKNGNIKMVKIPISPISTVSESSIMAVLEPLKTTYLFFVADKNGKVYYANTNQEHEQIIKTLKSQGLWYTY